jgi:hypothetical protein
MSNAEKHQVTSTLSKIKIDLPENLSRSLFETVAILMKVIILSFISL